MYAIMNQHSGDNGATVLKTTKRIRDAQAELRQWKVEMAEKGAVVAKFSDSQWVGVTYAGAFIARWIERQ